MNRLTKLKALVVGLLPSVIEKNPNKNTPINKNKNKISAHGVGRPTWRKYRPHPIHLVFDLWSERRTIVRFFSSVRSCLRRGVIASPDLVGVLTRLKEYCRYSGWIRKTYLQACSSRRYFRWIREWIRTCQFLPYDAVEVAFLAHFDPALNLD